MRLDAPLGDQFLRDAGGHAARGFREDAFGFGEQLDGGYDLGIGDVFGPAAGVPDLVHRKRAVGRITDGQRARDGIGFLRLEASQVALHRIGDGRAAGCLRAEEFHRFRFDPA